MLGGSFAIGADQRRLAGVLRRHGGSAIGNSRVKLTNVKDCIKRGLVREGQNPLQVAAEQLVREGVDVLNTIGGDDTNTTAADLAAYLAGNNYQLTVIGLPKTIDNDVFPIRQSLGAWTATEEGALFFERVVAEGGANPRMLIVHEVMDRAGNVIVFISEGAGVESIVVEMTARGQEVPRDAFGHVKLDAVNPGKWFGEQFARMLGAEKVFVQKSGYFARSASANPADLALIDRCVEHSVGCALRRESGVVGEDEGRGNELRAIEFNRIKGGKPFATNAAWFDEILRAIAQPKLAPVAAAPH